MERDRAVEDAGDGAALFCAEGEGSLVHGLGRDANFARDLLDLVKRVGFGIDAGRQLSLYRGGQLEDEGNLTLVATRLGVPEIRHAGAESILRGVEGSIPRVLIGRDARVIDLMTRLFPALTNTLVGRFQRRIPFV